MPRQPRNGAAHLAVTRPMNASGPQPVRRHILLSYNEVYPVEYLERRLRPYWRRNGQGANVMLATAEEQYTALEDRGKHFDETLSSDLERIGGKAYAELGALA